MDVAVHSEIVSRGAFPSPLGYCNFPKSICTSVNEVMCHGIPDTRPLVKGDLVSVDTVSFLNGYHGDCCGSFIYGKNLFSDEEEEQFASVQKLIQVSKEATYAGINVCRSGLKIEAIGHAIS